MDPLSVLRLSFFFYSVLLFIWLVFVAIAYGVMEMVGVSDAIESLGDALVLSFDLTLFSVEKWAFAIGVILVLVGTLVNVFLAVLYNIAADLFGGVEVIFVERDS